MTCTVRCQMLDCLGLLSALCKRRKNKGQSCQQLWGQSWRRNHNNLWSNGHEAPSFKQATCFTRACRAEALGFASEWLLFQLFIKLQIIGDSISYTKRLQEFLRDHKAARKVAKQIFDPPHHPFHLLLVVFSRMVQEKALKTIFIFKLSTMFTTPLQL